MITVSLCIALFVLLAVYTFLHLFFGPRSEHPISGLWAYVAGVVPTVIAFSFVALIDRPQYWQAIVNLLLMFAMAAVPPVAGRLYAAWQELEDLRFSRARHAESDSI